MVRDGVINLIAKTEFLDGSRDSIELPIKDAKEIVKTLVEQEDQLKKIVRCKDCIYHENQGTSFGWIPCMEIMTGDNWFCGSGKGKEK